MGRSKQPDQNAYITFPRVLTETELLAYIISNENKHPYHRNPTSINVNYFEQINLDNNFITEDSETSDNRPYTTSNISPEEHKKNSRRTQPQNITPV